MEIRQFKYFVRIADLGSLTKASAALHIAQPALSQQMAQLEEELGQPLFVRSRSGVSLTEAGETFYKHAQRIIKQLADIPTAVNHAGANPCGTVRVGLPQSTASSFAFPLLSAVQANFPAIELVFYDELSGNILHGVNSGRLDLGVVVSDEDATLLSATPLMDEDLFLASRADMAPPGRRISLERLVELPLALPGMEHGVRALVEKTALAKGLHLANVVVAANSMSIMRCSMLEGIAHCVMPWGAIATEIATGTLVTSTIEPPLKRRNYVCSAKDSPLSLAGQTVHDCLIAVVRKRVRAGKWEGVNLL